MFRRQKTMSETRTVTKIPAKQYFGYRKVGIYCRVSTKSQEQMDSLAAQVSLLTRLAATRVNWMLVDVYLDIRSGSGATSRSEFQRMMDDCRAKKLNIVFTKSISRFGRNTVETLKSLNELGILGVEVIFQLEDISTKNPDSQLMVSLLEGIAQQENEERRNNILWGMTRRAENGTSTLYNRMCYGYTHDDGGDLRVIEAEAAIVRSIFDMYLHGKSVLGIQRELEARGIKSPTGKDRWCKRSIEKMLSNEKYSGDVIIFKTYSMGFPDTKRKVNEPAQRTKFQSIGNHPAIISKGTFLAVQAERKRRSNIEQGEEGIRRKATKFSSRKHA